MIFNSIKTGAFLLLLVLTGCAATEVIVQSEAHKNSGLPNLSPTPQMSSVAMQIADRLNYSHYVEKAIDDGLSAQIFELYLQTLDKSKIHFLASDIVEFEQYRYQLDDTLKQGKLAPGFIIYNRYQLRSVERLNFMLRELENWSNYEFIGAELFDKERSGASWEVSEKELNRIWRQRLEAALLSLKLTGKSLDESKEILIKRYKSALSRVHETRSMDVFKSYMNALTMSYDPHSRYYAPRSNEKFNIDMKLSLEGIGVVLQTEDDRTKVVRPVPSGPSDGKLFPGDKIVSVGQNETELVDVTGWRIDEVVELVRGPKNTYVHLEVIRYGSSSDDAVKIKIERLPVKLIEQKVRKKIVDIEGHRIGIIYIPSFYIDFHAMKKRDPNYVSTTRDVRRLLTEIKESGVDGIVLDLRDNGGGALTEANSLTGLFLNSGPIIQVKDDRDRVDVYRDTDNRSFYDGPLVVLVNRLSASATEIFAGALQDYRRAVIVGDTTFGMGSVSALRSLSLGQLKITQAKFYRVTGSSNHLQGITPDINLPSLYDHSEIGESSMKNTLPEDRLGSQKFSRFASLSHHFPELRKRSKARVDSDPDMIYLTEYVGLMDEIRARKIVLNEEERRQQQLELRTKKLNLENKRRKAKGMETVTAISDLGPNSVSKLSIDFENDALLRESGHVLVDLIKLQSQ